MTHLLHSAHYERIEQCAAGAVLAGFVGCVYLVSQRLTVFPEAPVRYAVTLIILQAAVQFGLIVGLSAWKLVRASRERVRAERRRTLEDLLARPECRESALAAARQWPREFLSAAGDALQFLSGSARLRIATLLEASAPYPNLLQDCCQSDPSRAIRALLLVGKLGNPEARQAVSRCLDHPLEAVRRAARQGIVTRGDAAQRRLVLSSLESLPLWERLILLRLHPPDRTLMEFLVRSLASGDDERILIAFEVALTQQRMVPAALPARLAESANLEVRIKFFRTLPFLQIEGGAEAVLERGLSDADWRVRASAARACGLLHASRLAPRLLEMCRRFDDPAEAGHAARARGSWARRLGSLAGGSA